MQAITSKSYNTINISTILRCTIQPVFCTLIMRFYDIFEIITTKMNCYKKIFMKITVILVEPKCSIENIFIQF